MNRIRVKGILTHNFLDPLVPLDPLAAHIEIIKMIESFRSENPHGKVVWISTHLFPKIYFLEVYKIRDSFHLFDEIEFYEFTESDLNSEQTNRIDNTIHTITHVSRKYDVP